MAPLRVPAVATLAAAMLAAIPATAQWNPSGVSVCGPTCVGYDPIVIPDGAGGIYVAWTDSRSYSVTDDDAYLQRITAAGTIAPGWPDGGLPVCALPSTQHPRSLALDRQGGVLIAWYDARNVELRRNLDIYVQRIRGDGSIAPGWPPNGVPATRAPDYQNDPELSPDGNGGAFVVWLDYRDDPALSTDIYAQHLTAVGIVATGWPEQGLPICAVPGFALLPLILSGVEGGFIAVWIDARSGGEEIYGQRVLPDGSIAPGWVADGKLLMLGRTKPRVAPDGIGGFYVAAPTTTPGGSDLDYRVQRFTIDGVPAAGWLPEGVEVCGAPGVREGLRVAPDGGGGLLLSWYDYRPATGGSDIYASRVLPNGVLAPGWAVNGTRVSDPNHPNEFQVDIAPDHNGGAYIAWEDEIGGTPFQRPSFLQRLTGAGSVAPGWPQYGVRMAPSNVQFTPRLASDDAGGVIAVWDESNPGRLGIYAQRFGTDGPVATQVTLLNAQAEPDRVVLTWQGIGLANLSTTVSRRTDESDWERLGTSDADGPDRVRYEDRLVMAGGRYSYRLGYMEDGVERFTAETWVDVPSAHRFALMGPRPHPIGGGNFTVAFSLARAEAATLGLYDLTGRRVLEREVGSLGPGQQLLRISEGIDLPAGIYWLTLTQGSDYASRRVIAVK